MYTADSVAATVLYSSVAFPAVDANNSSSVHTCIAITVNYVHIENSLLYISFDCKLSAEPQFCLLSK